MEKSAAPGLAAAAVGMVAGQPLLPTCLIALLESRVLAGLAAARL
jgi:hypothetical protein